MKSLVAAYPILLVLAIVGIFNVLRLPLMPSGPHSPVVLPLYSNDSNTVIAQKIKLSASHATIEPSTVLPFMPRKNK